MESDLDNLVIKKLRNVLSIDASGEDCKDRIIDICKTKIEVVEKNRKSISPYGYLKDTEDNYKLVIDERVADNVRYIFQLLLEGHTLNETAKILNSEGVITARARRKEIKGYDAYANMPMQIGGNLM